MSSKMKHTISCKSVDTMVIFSPINESRESSPISCTSQLFQTQPVTRSPDLIAQQRISNYLTTRRTIEMTLKEMLFTTPSPLLDAYATLMNGISVNHHLVTVLLNFFASRGKVVQLIEYFSKNEVSSTNRCNPLFRGNTSFIRIYSLYLRTFCAEFISSTSVQLLKDFEGVESIDDAMILENFSALLLENSDKIPTHLKIILRSIYNYVLSIRGADDARNAFVTLLFLRYLYTPFMKNVQILKLLQKANIDIFLLKKYEMSFPLAQFRRAVDVLFTQCIKEPLENGSILLNPTLQGTSFKEMFETLKFEMSRISNVYRGDFNDVFSLIKGKVACQESTESIKSVEELNVWTQTRIENAQNRNSELKRQIEYLK
ncbi:hypothetical protein EIN_380200, partial [Entamoeba invadens IP1]